MKREDTGDKSESKSQTENEKLWPMMFGIFAFNSGGKAGIDGIDGSGT